MQSDERAMTQVLTSATVEDTRAIGRAMSELVRPGDVLSLTGELGAGKTAFVQGLALGLQIQAPVSSPTFVLQRDYDEGRLPMHHLDVYRLQRLQEVIDLGFEETIDEGAVTCIEWGDMVSPLFPESWLGIDLTADLATEVRTLVVTGHGERWAAGASELANALERWRREEGT